MYLNIFINGFRLLDSRLVHNTGCSKKREEGGGGGVLVCVYVVNIYSITSFLKVSIQVQSNSTRTESQALNAKQGHKPS